MLKLNYIIMNICLYFTFNKIVFYEILIINKQTYLNNIRTIKKP